MDQEELAVCMRFKDSLLNMLEDIKDAAMCIVPLGAHDKKIIGDGLDELDSYVSGLRHVDTIRELNQYIDVNRLLQESDDIMMKLTHNTSNDSFLDFMNSIQKLSHDSNKG